MYNVSDDSRPFGAIPADGARGRGPDAAEFPLIGAGHAVKEVCGEAGGITGSRGQDLLSGEGSATVYPREHRAHVGAVSGRGMEKWGDQRLGPVAPMIVAHGSGRARRRSHAYGDE
jgi:hypothetical protein